MEDQFGPWELTQTEKARIDEYEKLCDLVSRRAEKYDAKYQRDKTDAQDDDLPQLYVNLPGLVCRASADLVLPEPPTISAEDDGVQERLDALMIRSGIYRLSWRTVYWTAALGDSFLTIADVPLPDAKTLPVLSLRRAVRSVARGVRVEDPPAMSKYLFKSSLGDVDLYTEHVAGKVLHHAYKGGEKTDLPEPYQEEVATKEGIPLVVHLAALRESDDDEQFGESDFEGTESLVFEVANRLRQVARVLDRHADPSMNVPDGVIDEHGQHEVRKKKVYERGVDGRGMEYATWESQLKEAYAEIDRLLKLILLVTETPPALWGLDEKGQAESGRALMFRLLSGLGKARRTGSMLREGLAKAATLALRREDVIAGKSPGTYEVEVELSDTFIVDDMDQAEWVESLRRSQALSIENAVRTAQNLTGDDLEEEVKRINAEAEEPEAPVGLEAGRFTGDDEGLGKLPLAMQQLTNARKGAIEAGDQELATQIAKKQVEVLGRI